ncbi:hypothetical protein [Paraflavitalea speifideaquila]|uniref:hypothetical protein n=1 Tax=Paraflavitalea speifideaquila TaxID=3076558 RepID=UPI0028EE379B|nr:hypothetical protein [Paraflavitalea speifideiaquila]
MKYPLRWLVLAIMVTLTACSENDKNVLEVKGSMEHVEQIAANYPGVVDNGKVKLSLYEIPFGGDKAQPVLLDTITIPVTQKSFRLKGAALINGGFIILPLGKGLYCH